MRPLRPTLPKSMIDYAQQRQHLALLDDVLEEQGYHYREEDGRLVGPRSWPWGAPSSPPVRTGNTA